MAKPAAGRDCATTVWTMPRSEATSGICLSLLSY